MRIVYGVLAACLLFGLTGCSSNNKDKIVGKWEAMDGGEAVVEFTADGRFSMTRVDFAGAHTLTGNYSLGFGDNVTLSNLSEALEGERTSHETIIIKGDQLTFKGEKSHEDVTFRRVK